MPGQVVKAKPRHRFEKGLLMTANSVVIGCGLGGLAGALRLAAQGHNVTVVDRLSGPGGRALSNTEAGYTFDGGPTIITAPHLIEELFELHGRKLTDYTQLVECDPWYRIRFHDGTSFDYSSSLEKTLAEIRKFEPKDADRYLKFLDSTTEIFRVGFEELGDQPFLTPWSMIKLLPTMVRLKSYRSVWTNTARHLKNPKIRQVFSFHPLLVGGNPFTTTSIYSLIHVLERKWGVHFAMGGTGALVRALHRLAEEVGVDFRFGETAQQIELDQKRVQSVQLESGPKLRADHVVCNADPPWVYRNLLPQLKRERWTDRKIERLKYSMGLFVLYFGARRTWSEVAHHEIHLGPRYQGLIGDIFRRGELAEDFSLYLHTPTRTDPTLAPPGSESMYALVPVPNLREGREIDWQEKGPWLRDKLLDRLEESPLPGLKENLEVDYYVTPEHFKSNLLSHHGTGFSVQPTLDQSAWFRFHNQSEEVEGLYFVGAGTQPGAGVPGVLCSAKITSKLVEKAERRTGSIHSSRLESWKDAQNSKDVIRQHAKTFYLASRFLPRQHRGPIRQLYAFCRYVDDLVDHASDEAAAKQSLEKVRDVLTGKQAPTGPLREFTELQRAFELPLTTLLDFLSGQEQDLDFEQPQSFDALIRYCYRVAGTVGVLFSRIVGVKVPEALRRAVDLGIAMQLTNIARDVREDYDRGRLYLPSSCVASGTVESAIEGSSESLNLLRAALEQLLSTATEYYRSADAGLVYLPLSVRPAVFVASRAYEKIGEKVLSSADLGLQDRIFTKPLEKFGSLFFRPRVLLGRPRLVPSPSPTDFVTAEGSLR